MDNSLSHIIGELRNVGIIKYGASKKETPQGGGKPKGLRGLRLLHEGLSALRHPGCQGRGGPGGREQMRGLREVRQRVSGQRHRDPGG